MLRHCHGTRPMLLTSALLLGWAYANAPAQEPPALNPFGTPAERSDSSRDDAVPGVLETSDGKRHPGQISLTRETRLKIYDEARKQHREVPLRAIRRIDCRVMMPNQVSI